MEDNNFDELFEIDPSKDWGYLESLPVEGRATAQAQMCFLLSYEIYMTEIARPIPGVSLDDRSETDVIHVPYEHYYAEYYITDSKKVIFDHLYTIEDKSGNEIVEATPGVFSMQIYDSDLDTTDQFIFALDNQLTPEARIYFGFEMSEETLITDEEQLQSLFDFCKRLTALILREEVAAAAPYPQIDIDEFAQSTD